jgi:hypothetical protein
MSWQVDHTWRRSNFREGPGGGRVGVGAGAKIVDTIFNAHFFVLNTNCNSQFEQDWNMSIQTFRHLDINVPNYGTLKQVLMCEMQNCLIYLTVSSITQDYMSEFQATWLHLFITTEDCHSQSLQVCSVSSRHFSAGLVLARLPCLVFSRQFCTCFCRNFRPHMYVFVGFLVINL